MGVEGAVSGCMCATAPCPIECASVSKFAGVLIAVFSFLELLADVLRVGSIVGWNQIASTREYEVFGKETLVILGPGSIGGIHCVVSVEESDFVVDYSVPWVL